MKQFTGKNTLNKDPQIVGEKRYNKPITMIVRNVTFRF